MGYRFLDYILIFRGSLKSSAKEESLYPIVLEFSRQPDDVFHSVKPGLPDKIQPVKFVID